MKTVIKTIRLNPDDIELIDERIEDINGVNNFSEYIHYLIYSDLEKNNLKKEFENINLKLEYIDKQSKYLEHFLYVFMDFDLGLDGNLKEFKKDAIRSLESELNRRK